MIVKGELSLSELQKIAGVIRGRFPEAGQVNRLGHLEIAALLFRLDPTRVVWSSSFSRKALHIFYDEIRSRGGGQHPDHQIVKSPHCALGFAAGLAFAASLQRGKPPVYCSLTDGDQLLGGVWEAAIRAIKLRLDNLMVFVADSACGTGLVADKYAACGWNVLFIDAANIVEGHNLLSSHESRGVPSVILTRPVTENAGTKAALSNRQTNISKPGLKASFCGLMKGVFHGIAAVPCDSDKAVFLVTSPRGPCGFPEEYGKNEEIFIVDCGVARATALALAKGFREAGGIPFVVHRGSHGFSVFGFYRGNHGSVRCRHIEYPRSALEAKTAILRLWNLEIPWQLRIKYD